MLNVVRSDEVMVALQLHFRILVWAEVLRDLACASKCRTCICAIILRFIYLALIDVSKIVSTFVRQ